jgi:hypothetical protein
VLGEHENGDLSPAIRLTDEQYRDVTEALIAAGASVEAALALADYPRGRSPINYPPNDLSTFPPHLDDIVFVNSCVLQPLLLARIHTGDGMGALRVCRAILNLGRSIGDEPLWRSQRLRQLRHGEAVRGLERLLGQCDMTEAELAAFVPALAEETEHDAWETIWRGERAVTFQVLEAVRQGQLKPRAIRAVRPVTTTTTIDNVQDWFRDRFPPDTRPSAAWALRRYSRLLEMAKLPWPQRRAAVNALAAELAGAPDLAGELSEHTGPRPLCRRRGGRGALPAAARRLARCAGRPGPGVAAGRADRPVRRPTAALPPHGRRRRVLQCRHGRD